ncbi:hypothetical protein [Ramlibacter albus]|uniref:Secreted protein n=1 Tax=Ramlibacter albus TaxID=2079448 RepID=A0A923M4N0_9BURK|nr:hypothetical protein [Ramlibacter albus]MBC5763771.1 hypothetical protein [Ramlibacter albus]
MRKPSRSLLLLAAGLLVGSIATAVFVAWRADPQGEANAWCDKFAGGSVVNGQDMTVSWHTTACTTLGTSVVTYVYVHPSREAPGPSDLVLRYEARGVGDVLKATWIGERRVVLEVDDVSNISAMRTTAGPISIEYKIKSDVKVSISS